MALAKKLPLNNHYMSYLQPKALICSSLFTLAASTSWATDFGFFVIAEEGLTPTLNDYMLDVNLLAIGDGDYTVQSTPVYFREADGTATNGGVSYPQYISTPPTMSIYMIRGTSAGSSYFLSNTDALHIFGKNSFKVQDSSSNLLWFSPEGEPAPAGSDWIPAVRDADLRFDATVASGTYNLDALLDIQEGSRLSFRTGSERSNVTYTSIVNINNGLEGKGTLQQEGTTGELVIKMASPYFEGTLEIERKITAEVPIAVGSLRTYLSSSQAQYDMKISSANSPIMGLLFQGDTPDSGQSYYWEVPVVSSSPAASYLQVEKTGTGTLVASSSSTFAGGVNLVEGTISLTKGSSFDSGQPAIIAGPLGTGSVRVGTGSTLEFNLSGSDSTSLHNTIELSGSIANKGSVEATISDVSSISLNAVGGVEPELRVRSSGNLVVNAPISGSDSLLLTTDEGATGLIILGGANTFSGGVTINSTAQVTCSTTQGEGNSIDSGALGRGTVTVTAQGVLDLNSLRLFNDITLHGGVLENTNSSGLSYISGGFAITGNTVVRTALNGSGDSMQFNSSITGSGSLEKQGTKDIIFNNANTYTGSTKIYGGSIKLYGTGSIATSSSVVLQGGLLDISYIAGSSTTIKNIQGESDLSVIAIGTKQLTIQNEEMNSYAGQFTGSGTLRFEGAGSTTLSGDSWDFEGHLICDQNMTISNYFSALTLFSDNPDLVMTLRPDPDRTYDHALLRLLTPSEDNQLAGKISLIPTKTFENTVDFKLIELPTGYSAQELSALKEDIIGRFRSSPFFKIQNLEFDENRVLRCQVRSSTSDEIISSSEFSTMPLVYRNTLAALLQHTRSSNERLQGLALAALKTESVDTLQSIMRSLTPSDVFSKVRGVHTGRSGVQAAQNALSLIRGQSNVTALMGLQGYRTKDNLNKLNVLRHNFHKIQNRLALGGEPATQSRMEDFQNVDVNGITFSSQTTYSHESIDSTSTEDPGTKQSSWATSLSAIYSPNKLSAIGAIITTTKNNENLKPNTLSKTDHKEDRYNTAGIMGVYQGEKQPWFVSMVATYGQHNNDNFRTWSQYTASENLSSSIECQATAIYKSYELYLSLETGWQFTLNPSMMVQPYIGSTISHIAANGFQEASSNSSGETNDYGLIVPAQSDTTQAYTAGIEMQYAAKVSDKDYQWVARLGGTTEKKSGQTTTYTYAYQYAPEDPITQTQENQRLNTFDVMLGVSTELRSNMRLSLMYTGNFSSSTNSNTALASFEYQFS